MKQNYLKKLMTALLLLCCTVASAQDFEVDEIYYNILSFKDKTVEVTSGSNEYSVAVTIPASVTYNSITYSVTSIGDYAFYGCTSLTNVTIGNGVTSIGDLAFSDCYGLTSVEIPEGVTSIGDYAFYFCYGLTSVEIPEGVTSIGDGAFHRCSGLTSVEIPASVTSIGDEAFRWCSGLTSIVVDEGNTVYDSRNNCNAIIETASNTLIIGCKNTIIPSGITSIGNSAFSDCYGLTSIEIPVSVTSIGDDAFYSCNGLTSIVVDEGNTVYDSRNNCNAIIETASNTLILGCKNTIIPASVTSIGDEAFRWCSGLTSIEIPASVTSIGNRSFSSCDSLTSIVVDDGNSVYDSRNNCNAIIETASNTLIIGCKNSIIPASVTSIGDWAFAYCRSLTSIEIPSSVTSIGDWAFAYCRSLTSIEIPSSVTSIGNYAFELCDGLTSIEIPASVTSIGDLAFSCCYGLKSITSHIAAENLFVPGYDAFYGVGKTNCTLYVPAGAKSTYESTDVWKDFKNIVEMSSDGSDATAIESVESEQGEAVYYDLSGRRVENPEKGIYIVNGRKVFIK